MKVYVVTAGCYSDYHIEAVFTDEQAARLYAHMDSDREVEEYDADSVQIGTKNVCIEIWYGPKSNEIYSYRMLEEGIQDRRRQRPDTYMYHHFVAQRRLSARMLKDIQEHGKDSPLLLKAMQDAWSAFRAEHELDLGFDFEEEEEKEKIITVGPEGGALIYKAFFASTSSAACGAEPEGADGT